VSFLKEMEKLDCEWRMLSLALPRVKEVKIDSLPTTSKDNPFVVRGLNKPLHLDEAVTKVLSFKPGAFFQTFSSSKEVLPCRNNETSETWLPDVLSLLTENKRLDCLTKEEEELLQRLVGVFESTADNRVLNLLRTLYCVAPARNTDIRNVFDMFDVNKPHFRRYPSFFLNCRRLLTTCSNFWFLYTGITCVGPHFDQHWNSMTVLLGKKTVVLFPPSELENMYMSFQCDEHGALATRFPFDPDLRTFESCPKFRKAYESAIICELYPGDTMVWPPFWWHHVLTEGPSLAFNEWVFDEQDVVFAPLQIARFLIEHCERPSNRRHLTKDYNFGSWLMQFASVYLKSEPVDHDFLSLSCMNGQQLSNFVRNLGGLEESKITLNRKIDGKMIDEMSASALKDLNFSSGIIEKIMKFKTPKF
jgi:hypothetical protein